MTKWSEQTVLYPTWIIMKNGKGRKGRKSLEFESDSLDWSTKCSNQPQSRLLGIFTVFKLVISPMEQHGATQSDAFRSTLPGDDDKEGISPEDSHDTDADLIKSLHSLLQSTQTHLISLKHVENSNHGNGRTWARTAIARMFLLKCVRNSESRQYFYNTL